MSHEIRTPMNAIIGFTEILEGKIRHKQQRRYLSLIRDSGRSLLALIDDILDLSKIEAGKMKLDYKPLHPVSLFEEISNLFLQKMLKKKLVFLMETDPDLPEYLLLDDSRLRQILLNLLGNAVKFTDSGTIRLVLKSRPHDNTPGKIDFIFSVEDTGIGIPEKQRKTIFNAFEQQEGQNHSQYGGTGLGLAITCRLVEMMGGVISVTDNREKGSIFTVVLKNVCKADPPARSEKPLDISTDSIIFDKAAILIVDDIPDNRLLLLKYLEEYQFVFLEAEDGRQAVHLAKKHLPDLILMDMKMPMMDGREATEKLSEEKATKNIPVIAVTASAMKEAEAEIRSLCDGYIGKPINKTALIEEIKRFIPYSVKKDACQPDSEKAPKEEKGAAFCALDAETFAKLPELMKILTKEFTPRWKEILEVMDIDNVKNFAEDIKKIGENYHFHLLVEYGSRLKKHTQEINIEGIQEYTNKFPALMERIRCISNRRDNLNDGCTDKGPEPPRQMAKI